MAQDHCLVLACLGITKPEGSMAASPWASLSPFNFIDFFSNGTGILSDNNFGVNGVMHTPSRKKDKRPGMYGHR
jgi:hypothetical protein